MKHNKINFKMNVMFLYNFLSVYECFYLCNSNVKGAYSLEKYSLNHSIDF